MARIFEWNWRSQPFSIEKNNGHSAFAVHHRCRSRQIFGGAKDFCPTFSRFQRKIFVWLMPTIILPKNQERSSCVFSQTLGAIFLPDCRGFYQKFQKFCPDFQQIKTFGSALPPPATPPPTPLLFSSNSKAINRDIMGKVSASVQFFLSFLDITNALNLWQSKGWNTLPKDRSLCF